MSAFYAMEFECNLPTIIARELVSAIYADAGEDRTSFRVLLLKHPSFDSYGVDLYHNLRSLP